MHCLMVQTLSGVQSPRSRVQSKLAEAEWISAAQQSKGQFVFLISVSSVDLQDFRPRRFVFRDVHLVPLLRELGSVIVGVNDTDQHLGIQTESECVYLTAALGSKRGANTDRTSSLLSNNLMQCCVS